MNNSIPRFAVYPGSFDPITLGHLNVVARARQLFDELIVGIGVNAEKRTMFSGEERVDLVRKTTADMDNVTVRTFSGLAVNFARECGAHIMIRGVRPITDIPAEMTMMMANRRLAPDVETLFMVADGELAHVSSSLIKQITPLAGREELRKFLPEHVADEVCKKLGQ